MKTYEISDEESKRIADALNAVPLSYPIPKEPYIKLIEKKIEEYEFVLKYTNHSKKKQKVIEKLNHNKNLVESLSSIESGYISFTSLNINFQ